jgi:hypothetical protein
MRTIIAVLVFGVAVSAGAGSASAAAPYPWCAHYAGRNGGTNCGFVSFPQCMAAISGNGGYCDTNPFYYAGRGYDADGAVVVPSHKHRHYRHHRSHY